MGNKPVKGALKPKDVARFANSGFSAEEIQALHGQFLALRGNDSIDSPYISLSEFQGALGFRGKETSIFLERVFKLMDFDNNGHLTFEEFINGVAVFSPVPSERKYRFTFSIYDLDDRGKISPTNLKIMLSHVLKENTVAMTESQVDALVSNTFREHDVNKDGYIDYEEYKQMCVVNPSILKPLTINVSEILRDAKAQMSK